MSDIKLAHSVRWDASDDDLLFMQQIGLQWTQVVWGDDPTDGDDVKKVVERFASYDLGICTGAHGASSSHRVQLGQDGRDEEIVIYRTFLKAIGANGIPLCVYSFHPANTYTTHFVERRGYTARAFDLQRFRDEVEKDKFDRQYPLEEIWEHYTYFMDAVLPVAGEAGVTMALHPDDPPVEMMNGVGKMITHYKGYARAEEVSKGSDHWGLLFCVGTWSEGGTEMGKDVFGMIDDFGRRGKIAEVHFRNVNQPMPSFEETFPDDGFVDMSKVLRALHDVCFNGPLLPDHIPKLVGDDDSRAGLAYSVAYIRALLKETGKAMSD